MDDSDGSSLSSVPSSADESTKTVVRKTLTLKGGKLSAGAAAPFAAKPRKRHVAPPPKSPSPSPERDTSPPHEYVLADNPDIAVLVMFRSRFADVFPKNVPNLGPQDIENGVVGEGLSQPVENFLCALIGLVLNRKKDVERGHYGRALEECLSSQKNQWPISWGGMNPLPGTKTFINLTPAERIDLLKTLTIWALSTSEVISNIIKESYKQSRHEDDLNQPLSVQPWGVDGRRRRYWLIEGQSDTTFRLYRESAAKSSKNTWWSLAGTINELKEVGEQLRAEGSQAARRLADKFAAAIPRLEASDEKRKKQEYRRAQRQRFTKPEPGFSLYEGRTRGKRMRYTFSDEEDSVTEGNAGLRRSARGSSRDTPGDPTAPTVTQSGRQVRSRFGRSYGEPIYDTNGSTPQVEDDEVCGGDADRPMRSDGRPRRSGRARRGQDDYGSLDELDDEEEAVPSGDQWSGNDDDMEEKYGDDHADEADEDDDVMSDEADDNDSLLDEPRSLIVSLRYKMGRHGGMAERDTGIKEEHVLHGSQLKATAISSVNGASSDMTIGEALKESNVSALSTTIDQPSTISGPPIAEQQIPKQEVEDAAMPDVTSQQHLSSSHADGLEESKAYQDSHYPSHNTAEQSRSFATQAPAFVASSVQG